MRNKDLKLQDTKTTSTTDGELSETIILENVEIPYEVLLENYYQDLKEGRLPMPEEKDMEGFLSEMLMLADLEMGNTTIH